MPRSSPHPAPARHTAGPAHTRADLDALRPDLVAGYDAELPGARAAVLARLIGALDREDLPGLVYRDGDRELGIGMARFADGTEVRYPARAAALFAPGTPGLAVRVTRPGGPGPENHRDETGADPGALVRLLWPDTPLAAEVDNSVANLALARADRPAPDLPAPHDLGRIEQLLTDGHPVHPCCRTRGGMTVADVLAYAPEHSPVIRLRRFRVPADRWYGTAPPILFAHPWQAARLQDRYPWLADDGETGPARPLMSLRTVAPLGGGPHVKTAVDVQMTSAVRTVSPAAVHNGPILSALIRTLTADLPIDILAETGAGAVVVDGQPQRHLAYLRREAPSLGRGETAVPMAVLSATPMLLGRVHDAYEFMALLGDVLFAPLLALLKRGVALEAHGQNTLVVLRDGRPVRILYRDLGGVRVSSTTVDLEGDLPSDDPQVLRDKLTAAAFSTVAAELIDALARTRGADEHRLWGIVAQAIKGTADGRHILGNPLPIKATTAMRLAADPLEDRWARIDNPMAA
ncbi:IucA/IucC family protein [Actinoplanes sp. NPDC051343]|uniref:IucA/IucC family protein n=1 Tax=Actinoplanes sp. NPDC051343 TaxID=3363906 RepID=UPI00378BC651